MKNKCSEGLFFVFFLTANQSQKSDRILWFECSRENPHWATSIRVRLSDSNRCRSRARAIDWATQETPRDSVISTWFWRQHQGNNSRIIASRFHYQKQRIEFILNTNTFLCIHRAYRTQTMGKFIYLLFTRWMTISSTISMNRTIEFNLGSIMLFDWSTIYHHYSNSMAHTKKCIDFIVLSVTIFLLLWNIRIAIIKYVWMNLHL